MKSLRKDLITATIAIVSFTLLLGVAYPLITTGVAQLLFPGAANGSKVEAGGEVVGSELIGQDFEGRPRYFQGRPSVTGYSADVTYFNNLGPNNEELSEFFAEELDAYLAREGRYDRGLTTAAAVPVDAVTTSASGVDPQISVANARIQAHRVAAVRRLPLERVEALIEEHTEGRFLVFGEPGVNVLKLNIALDQEAAR